MQTALEKLLGLSSDEIVPLDVDIAQVQEFFQTWRELGQELGSLLTVRNGFWAYESSLLVRPFSNGVAPLGIVQWNDKELWKGKYACDLDAVLFFAEDAFGCQYCIFDDAVRFFDPETCQFEELAASLEGWAGLVLEDYEYRTGYPLAHAWQAQNYPLRPGTRLLPNLPFVLQGRYELENLHVGDDVEGMIFRASIANQIRDIPDGSQIVLDLVNRTALSENSDGN